MTANAMPRLAGKEAAHLARRTAWVAVCTAILLAAIKTGAFAVTQSVAMLGSLVDSLLDIAASLLILFAIRRASLPADREHRFGHGKWEALAGLGQAALIAGSALFLAMESVRRLINPVEVSETFAGITVLLICSAVTIALVLYQRRTAMRTGSLAVRADSFHYSSDIAVNGGVIVALLLAGEWGIAWADGLIGLGLAFFIGWGTRSIIGSAFDQLTDHEFTDIDREKIKLIVLRHPEVRAVHDLRTRRSGFNTFIQFHLELDADMTLGLAHAVSDRVEAEVRAAFPGAEVIIHEDPAGQEVPPVFPQSVH